MAGDRWVLLGLAPARSGWFSDVAQWANAAALAAEFVKCVSVEEVRARLASGRRWSALIVDAAAPGLDRDLVATAEATGIPVIVVREARAPLWAAADLGVAAVLPGPFGREELIDVLTLHARTVGRGDNVAAGLVEAPGSGAGWRGRLVAVCGPGGTGASTLAAAVAQGLAADARWAGGVLLADLALRADQAMLHDALELGPGIQELVDAHRMAQPAVAEVSALTFEVPARRYRLLLGLRRPSAWTALRPRATEAAIDGLRRTFPVVVADVTADLDGEAETGSVELEERNTLARTAVGVADAVVAVGSPGMKGAHSLAGLMRELHGAGVPAERVLPVVNRARRDPRQRSQHAAALAKLAPGATGAAAPVWVPERRIEDALRDCTAIPGAIVAPVAGAVAALLERRPPRSADAALDGAPPRVRPGSLGRWADEG